MGCVEGEGSNVNWVTDIRYLRVGCVEGEGWNVNCVTDIRYELTISKALCVTMRYNCTLM